MQKIKISLLVFAMLAVLCFFAAGCEKQDTTQYTISVTFGTSDKTSAVAGDTITLTADAAPDGKEFSHWVVDGNRIGGNTFEMTSGNKSAVAVYKSTESGFLTEYDLDNVTIAEDASAETITFGSADFEPMVYTNGDYSLKYRIYIPDSYTEGKEIPLLMFFHGSGERGTDNTLHITKYAGFGELFTKEGNPVLDAIVIAPQCPADERWVGVPADQGVYDIDEVEESQAMSNALRLLKYYHGEMSVDADRIYAMGISMGGYGTWDILGRHTDLLAGAVPICGGCDPSIAPLLIDKPIYTFHSSTDTTVPPIGTQQISAAIKELGGKCLKFIEYPVGGHPIWNDAMRTENVLEWVFYNVMVTDGNADKRIAAIGDTIELTLTAEAEEGYEFSGWTVNGVAIEGDSFVMSGSHADVVAVFTEIEPISPAVIVCAIAIPAAVIIAVIIFAVVKLRKRKAKA